MSYYDDCRPKVACDNPKIHETPSIAVDDKKSCELMNADKKDQRDFEINKILSTAIESAGDLARDLAAISIFISGKDDEIFASLFAEFQESYDDVEKLIYVEGLATKLVNINSLYYQLKQISQAIKERL